VSYGLSYIKETKVKRSVLRIPHAASGSNRNGRREEEEKEEEEDDTWI
jgi:hypothetical protein